MSLDASRPRWRSRLTGHAGVLLFCLLGIGAFFFPQYPLEWFPSDRAGDDVLFLEVRTRTDRTGPMQIFYDTVGKFRQADSIYFTLAAQDAPFTFRFPLPDAPIRRLRVQTVGHGATHEISALSIVQRDGLVVYSAHSGKPALIEDAAAIRNIEDGWAVNAGDGELGATLDFELPQPVAPRQMRERLFERALKSTAYLSGMVVLGLLAGLFALGAASPVRALPRRLATLGLVASICGLVGNRGLIIESVQFAQAAPLPPALAATRWTMVNVNARDSQADSHLLQFPSGKFALIDIADANDDPGRALAALRERDVRELELVVISHFHTDHYGRLVELLESGVRVNHVALNVPAKSAADSERPWGCDWDDVQRVLAKLREHNVPYVTPQAGDVIYSEPLPSGGEVKLEVICAYDGENTPIGPTDVNDTSIILRLQHGNTRALFTGDLNFPLGKYLVESGADLRADLLKAPHHGTEGTAPDEFFEAVQAKAVLVPSPRNLWFSPRSKRVREFYRERGVPTYVNGIHGHVTVELETDSFRVMPQRR